jgi:hypothetical protein
MITIKGTVKNGQVVLEDPAGLPEGTEVNVTPRSSGTKIGLDPSEWRDDAAALADWASWITTFEPLEFTAEEEADLARFREAMRQFNIEAVRRQMEAGEP